jgi:hypothetical protein
MSDNLEVTVYKTSQELEDFLEFVLEGCGECLTFQELENYVKSLKTYGISVEYPNSECSDDHCLLEENDNQSYRVLMIKPTIDFTPQQEAHVLKVVSQIVEVLLFKESQSSQVELANRIYED